VSPPVETLPPAVDGRHVVCRLDELQPGQRRIVSIGGRQIGVIRTETAIYAIRNVCPHQGAELCRGGVSGTMLPSPAHEYVVGLHDRVLRCPWHGWEFDMETGKSVFDPDNVRVRTYPVTVEDGSIVIEVGGRERRSTQ
jgi:nitrite reductase/ring-hydroxylating ferredoxin subunit